MQVTDKEAVEFMRLNVSKLPMQDQEFVLSLISWHDKKGGLSEKQAIWMHRMLEQVECIGVADFTQGVEDRLFALGVSPGELPKGKKQSTIPPGNVQSTAI